MIRGKRISAVIIAVLFIFVWFLTSVQIAVYSDKNFYQKEYNKYNVLAAVSMEMDDLMYVTDEMLDYLIGKRSNLVVKTKIVGEDREFFNEREKTHMADVRNLFVLGLYLRNIAFFLLLALILFLKFIQKGSLRKYLPLAFLSSVLIFGGIFLLLGLIIAGDFSQSFITFHHILFPQNDFWILNPDTDLLINIVPEGFFMDMAFRIAMIFASVMLVLLLGSLVLILVSKKKVKIKNKTVYSNGIGGKNENSK